MKDILIDTEREVLGFSPTPPSRSFGDLVPLSVRYVLRGTFGWPAPTVREKWFLCLFFVRTALDTLLEERKKLPPAAADPNDRERFRWN